MSIVSGCGRDSCEPKVKYGVVAVEDFERSKAPVNGPKGEES